MNPVQATPQEMLQLKDIHLPLGPDMWPPAPGWWVLAAAALGFLVWVTLQLYRLWRRHRLQKEILASLDALQLHSDEQIPQFLAEISILLRRVAMMKFPRQQVAALTGKGWLSFLICMAVTASTRMAQAVCWLTDRMLVTAKQAIK